MKRGKGNLQRIIFAVLCVFYYGTLFVGYPCEAYASSVVFIEKEVYDFGTILEGKQITHDFIVENRGTETLEILRVRSTCACAVAEYSKEILPGGQGKITVEFDSIGSGGITADHKVRVETNDPERKELDLSVTGHVEPVAHISSKRVMLEGDAGDNIETEITITPDARHIFKVLSAVSRKGNVSCNLKEIKDSKPVSYMVTITNLKKEKGKYRDIVYLETDSNICPGISIKVKGDIR